MRVAEEKMRVEGLEEKWLGEMVDDENKALPKVSSFLEDEICLDEIPQEKKKPKKVISTKVSESLSNFSNMIMKEKERSELEEKEKSKKVKSKDEKKKEKEKRELLRRN